MRFLQQLNTWQASLAVSGITLATFALFSFGIGMMEQGILVTASAFGSSEYQHYATNTFRFTGSFSQMFLLGGIIGMLASILLYREFSLHGLDIWNILSGLLGGVVLGFGTAMLGGGALTYALGQIPLLALSGFIGVLFMVIGIYIGGRK